ncbi:S8 family peptidase [Paucisalibacillus globulus]|uniref:S8 family peptidase n=1 Tax=Paucisalibacillus globulus TaxID=351095 RepID=UPI000BB764D8|nr:S8 family peptidase [Paucisalibacillus globulus]
MKKTNLEITTMLNEMDDHDQLGVVIVLNNKCKATHVSELCPLQRTDQPTYHLREIHQITGRFCPKTIRHLMEHSDVEYICPDYSVRSNLNVATATIGAKHTNQFHGLTGKGITVSVIDTGIFPHYDLTYPTNRIVGFQDFVNSRTTPYDDNGHGTHVAGAIAGNGSASGGNYSGIAPEANVVGVKVLDSQGNGLLSNVIAGINWSIENRSRFGIRVINLSLGAPPTTSYVNDPLALACEKAWRAGIVVVAAAGNSGPNGTIDTPGYDPIILTVGATNDRNTIHEQDDTPGEYTSSKPTLDGFIKPDIAVPGTNIISLQSPNSTTTIQQPQNKVGPHYFTLTGTSMATGIVSGIVALLLQASPPYTPDTVKVRLMESSKFLTPQFTGYSFVTSLFNMTRNYHKTD